MGRASLHHKRRAVMHTYRRGVQTPAQTFGAGLRFYVDMRDAGNNGTSITDQVNGVVMTGTGTPTFTTSATYNNKRVAVFIRASAQAYESGDTAFDIIPTASRPYAFWIGRQTGSAPANQRICEWFGAGVTGEEHGLNYLTGVNGVTGTMASNSVSPGVAAPQAAPGLFEFYIDPTTGARTLSLNGTVIGSSGSGLSTAAALRHVVLAGIPSIEPGLGNAYWEGSVAAFGIALTATPAQRAAVRAFSNSVWATP